VTAPLVAGAVLAGGASRRFGADKLRTPLGGRRLVDRVVSALREAGVGPLVAIGGSAPIGDEVAVIADDHPGDGPLGGILTALRWSTADHTLVVAGDLPLLDPLTVGAVVGRAHAVPGAVALARAGGTLQPTCACWPRSALGPLTAAFDGGERSIARALAVCAVEPVDVPDRVLADVDTPADLALLERWCR
jgi:molybdenum cofactor guanylyltransferase